MTRPTIHFVYALPLGVIDKIALRLFGTIFTSSFRFDRIGWPRPIHAPLSISFHVAHSLSDRFDVKLYDLRSRWPITPRRGDILLAHPSPDPRSVSSQAFDDPRFARKILLSPYNADLGQTGWLSDLMPKVDRYVAISGEPWFNEFRSPFIERHGGKICRVDMGIDPDDYPLVKRRFSPPGARRFLYIGRVSTFGDEKGISLLERLASRIEGFSGGYVCRGGEIEGWRKISSPRPLDLPFMEAVAREYDVFINMSRFDAQVTTVLEAACWGFPVACTPQSGYREKSFFTLSVDDDDANRQVIETIQRLPSEHLARLARRNRELVATKYSWDRFAESIRSVVDEVMASPVGGSAGGGG